MSLDPFPISKRWPVLPNGRDLSIRDVGLLDLARHIAMQAAFPLGSIKADTDELWRVLKDRADDIGGDVDLDTLADMLEPGARAWAAERAAERRFSTTEEG